MSTTLEPREVEKPFARRWVRTSLGLLLRSPFRFGALIALLGWLDTGAIRLSSGTVIDRVWIDRLGTLLLPILWLLVGAVARGADDDRLTWQALGGLRRRSAWMGAVGIGIAMAALEWFFHMAFHAFNPEPARPAAYLQHPGDLLASIEASVVLIVGAGGLSYCPMLVLAPEASAHHARFLSQKADRINGLGTIMTLVAMLALTAIFVAGPLPAYGMTTAAFLVYSGVLNYVAYRDMFERVGDNLPRKAGVAEPRMTAQAVAR